MREVATLQIHALHTMEATLARVADRVLLYETAAVAMYARLREEALLVEHTIVREHVLHPLLRE